MGFPMAKNLRLRCDPAAQVYVNDINEPVVSKFVDMMKDKGEIIVVKSSRDIAESCVRF